MIKVVYLAKRRSDERWMLKSPKSVKNLEGDFIAAAKLMLNYFDPGSNAYVECAVDEGDFIVSRLVHREDLKHYGLEDDYNELLKDINQ